MASDAKDMNEEKARWTSGVVRAGGTMETRSGQWGGWPVYPVGPPHALCGVGCGSLSGLPLGVLMVRGVSG